MTTAVPLIYSFPEFSGVAEAVADLVITAQNKALTKDDDASLRKQLKESSKRFKISISGGSLINVLVEGLLNRDDIQWNKWDIYFSDERLVPFDSPESNYGQAKRKLFEKLKTKPNIYHIDESLLHDPQECADKYEKTLIKGFASKDSVKLPMFDLILLGCAPDGHVASLFPNHESLRENYAWCVPVTEAPVPPRERISLSIPVICHSHLVAFVVEGSTKAPVLRTIMERPDKGLPASILMEKAAGKVAWFVDDDAIKDVVGITKKRYKFTALNK
ncbi:unnamed protein product [Pichia kudriavzevii]|uniref:6-phosphogluconolactonase-like protein n=1 Tax=Pichia kudriavzevii TaxID=4909 RepID=A0A099P276_PICKU|nr:hypothetical protein JL09_g2541 [Pichia kudriavzevii]